MTSFRVRPRFRLVSPKPMEEIQEKVKVALQRTENEFTGKVVSGHIVLAIQREDRHYWSPQLSLSLEEDGNGTLIRGLYGPNPAVWAMFAFGYAALGWMTLFVSIIGFSRMNLGLPAPVLWFLPFFAIGFLTLYIIAQVGQKMGAEQTFSIHHFFEETLNEKVHIN